jgi:hypothetical protein
MVFVCLGDAGGFLKKGAKAYLMPPILPLNLTRQFIFSVFTFVVNGES